MARRPGHGRASRSCSSSSFVFAYFYLRSLNNGGRWRPRRRRSASGLRRRDRHPVRAERRLLRLCGPGRARRPHLAARRGARAGARARRLHRPGVRVGEPRVLADSRAATRASSSAGRSCSPCSCSSRIYWVEIVFATGIRHRRAAGGLRTARPRRRLLLLDAARGHRRGRLGDPLPALRPGVVDVEATAGLDRRTRFRLGRRRRGALLAGRAPRRRFPSGPTGAAGGPAASSPAWRRSCSRSTRRSTSSPSSSSGCTWSSTSCCSWSRRRCSPSPGPWNRMWHGLPLGFRRRTARRVAAEPRARARFDGWRRPAGPAGRPGSPSTSRSSPGTSRPPTTPRSPLAFVHALEHAMFFGTALLFWTRVIDSPPWRSPLGDGPAGRLSRPRDGGQLDARDRLRGFNGAGLRSVRGGGEPPGGITALADQQLAAGVMWVPGSIPLAIAILFIVYRWLQPERARAPSAVGARPRYPVPRIERKEEKPLPHTGRDLDGGPGDPHLGDPARRIPRRADLVRAPASPPPPRVTIAARVAQLSRKSPRSRRAFGVGDVAGERGDRAADLRPVGCR